MKSKTNRNPGNTNSVNKNIIHNENIKKEAKFFDKNLTEHFQLNPNNSNNKNFNQKSFITIIFLIK